MPPCQELARFESLIDERYFLSDQLKLLATRGPAAAAGSITPPTLSKYCTATWTVEQHDRSVQADATVVKVKIDVRQRWVERRYLASYLAEAVLGVFCNRALSPITGDLNYSADVQAAGLRCTRLMCDTVGSKRPVVLVPGWCGRTRSFRKLADRLAQEGHPVYPVPLGSQLGCIQRKAGLITQFLDKHNLHDVYVVAHSMGGLITVRSLMKGETRIRRLITMGTPYRGTHVIYLGWLAIIFILLTVSFYFSPLLSIAFFVLFLSIPSLRQMQPGAAFLTETLQWLDNTAFPVQCIYAIRDQIVIHNWRRAWDPTRLGRPGDVCLPEHGHMNLFMGNAGIELVLRFLRLYEAEDVVQRQHRGHAVAPPP